MIEAGAELDALIQQKVFGRNVVMRWAERLPSGGLGDIESSWNGLKGKKKQGWLGIMKSDSARFVQIPCYTEGDGFWHFIPPYSTRESEAALVVKALADKYPEIKTQPTPHLICLYALEHIN